VLNTIDQQLIYLALCGQTKNPRTRTRAEKPVRLSTASVVDLISIKKFPWFREPAAIT